MFASEGSGSTPLSRIIFLFFDICLGFTVCALSKAWLTLSHSLAAGLKVPHPILSQETVKSLFVPTLSDDSAKSLNTWMSPHNLGTDFQWGNALCLNTTDWLGKRRKLSGWCRFLLDFLHSNS